MYSNHLPIRSMFCNAKIATPLVSGNLHPHVSNRDPG